MRTHEEWSGARVAAALETLEAAGYSQSRIGRLAGVGQSTISRWSKGIVRPGYDAVRRLAVAVWRPHPDTARELVRASGYAWQEPEPEPEPLVDPELAAALRKHVPADAEEIIAELERRRSGGSREGQAC